MKRWLSFLMVLTILVTCVPSSALANARSADENVKRYSILVMETSGSASFSSNGRVIYTADSAVSYVKKAAVSFLKDLLNAPGDNYVAVVTYTDTATVLSDFTNDINDVVKKVQNIKSGNSLRNIGSGMNAANNLLSEIKDPKAVKNVILVSTGMTNDGASSYTGKYDKTTIGSGWYRTNTGINLYAYANAALTFADRVKARATLYVLGLFQTMNNMPEAGKDIASFFRLTASDLATSSDTFYDVEDPDNIDFAFGAIADDILSGYEVIHGKYKYPGSLNTKYDTESDYYYTDAYFFKDSAVYNESLATMSLALELSSWSSIEQPSWYRNASESDSNFFKDKLVNAKTLLIGNPTDKNSKDDPYRGIGFSYFDANEFWYDTPTKDSIGVCAARKQIQQGNEKYTLVALAVRGGGYGSEWASNFTLGSSGDHKGFAEARDNVLNWLNNEYLSKLESDESRNLKLWIVGYSRAGITANMVAGKIDSDPSVIKNGSIAPKDLFCYTFEAPQGIVKNQNGGVYQNIHNIRNLNDLVPMVAPSVWKFTRYNKKNDSIIPNAYTRGRSYADYHSDMKEQLCLMGFEDFVNHKGAYAKSGGYSIANKLTQKVFKVDKSKFLPGGDPLWWFEDKKSDTETLLDNGVTYLFDGVIKSRSLYSNRMENTVRTLTGILMHYDGALAGLTAELSNGIKVRFDFDYFISCVESLFTLDNVSYILGPIIAFNFDSFDTRLNKVEQRTIDVVSKAFSAYSYILTAVQFKSFINTLCDLLVDMFLDIATDLWDNNTTDINTISALVSVFSTMGFQGHYPEVTLAWVRSLDPNYNSDAIPLSASNTTRLIRINCPVNVYVYDNAGNLQASFVNDVAMENNSSLIHYLNVTDEKILYLPGDTEYRVEIIATGDGTVNFSLGEYNFSYDKLTRLRNYYDIPVQTGDKLVAQVPAISDADQEANQETGSNAAYQLSLSSFVLTGYEEFRGAEIDPKTYTVEIAAEGNGGYINGAGEFIQGSFAKVEASTLPNGQFYGWYIDKELVSTDPVYRFAVRGNKKLVAKFSDIELHHLQVVGEEGGTVSETDGYFGKDMEIALKAVPNPGWSFVGWTLEGDGILKEKKTENTSFMMGDTDAVIVAHFEYVPKTIRFDANGGKVSPDKLLTENTGKLPSLPDAKRSGYQLAGWYTTRDGGEIVTLDTEFIEDTTVYAHWTNALPDTGDHSMFFTWIIMLLGCMMALGVVRKNSKE